MTTHRLLLSASAILILSSLSHAQQLSIRPLIDGFPADAGFALGAAVSRTRTPGPIDVRAKTILSVKKYQLYEVGIEVPEFTRWLSFDVTSQYRNFPQEDFWGVGPNTPKSGRANYLLEGVDTTATIAAYLGKFRLGVNGGYERINTGPGHDKEFPIVPESLLSQPRFTHIGAFLEYNSLDEQANPQRGGMYSLQWTSYNPTFQRYTIDLRRFISIGATDRIGLRMQTVFTRSANHEEVPFFMLPTAGGSNTVRGFNHYRFRDRNALVLNAEYRRPLTGFLDFVAFADAGRVFARSKNLGLQDLHPSAGVGARVRLGTRVFFGVDFGFSNEGRKLWLRSDQMF
jgi:outer membrane protein assembly factor BamA